MALINDKMSEKGVEFRHLFPDTLVQPHTDPLPDPELSPTNDSNFIHRNIQKSPDAILPLVQQFYCVNHHQSRLPAIPPCGLAVGVSVASLSPTAIPPQGIAVGDSVATLSPTAIPPKGIAVGDSVATLSPTAIPPKGRRTP